MSDFDRSWDIYFNHYRPDVLFPEVTQPQKASQQVSTLLDIADEFDVLLLDGFGVLNVGPDAIPEMPAIINELVARGKHAFVLTNAATYPVAHNAVRYPNWGYNIPTENVISSRSAVEHALPSHPLSRRKKLWGVIGSPNYDPSTLNAETVHLTEENVDDVDGIIFLGAMDWNNDKHAWFIESLAKRPRPVLVGNPDVCAPLLDQFTVEPGTYSLDIKEIEGADLHFFGKPFQLCYALSFNKILSAVGNIDPSRVLMVGDTLHTDILGGNTFGMKTALMADYGFLRDQNPYEYIELSGITPDFVISHKKF